MASLFKKHEGGDWQIDYFDHTGRRRRKSSKTTDKRAAERIAARLGAGEALRREGVIDPTLDRFIEQDKIPLQDHVAEYVRHMELRNRSAKHVKAIKSFLEEIGDPVESLGAKRLSEITQDAVERYLHDQKTEGRSARTLNWRQVLIAGFVAWSVRTGRLAANPLLSLRRQDETRDQKRKRRALTADELKDLFTVAEKRGRKALYAAAYYARLRRGELLRLSWGDVNLDAATLTISKGKARNRIDVLPIAPPLLDELKRIRPALVLPTARVFPRIPTNDERIADFETAEIKSPDADDRYADLHSLRVTLATDLARQGVSVQVAQRLMRHSTVDLTLRCYTRLRVDDLAGGLAALANALKAVPDAQQKAMGTDGASVVAASAEGSESSQQNRQQSGHKPTQSDAKPRDEESQPVDAIDEVSDAPKSVDDADLSDETRGDALPDDWWTRRESNPEPTDYESAALTS